MMEDDSSSNALLSTTKEMPTMIRQASIYALKKLSDEEQHSYGLRILTMRRWPQGVRRKMVDLWVPSAGPSVELLVALHTRHVTWEQFIARYIAEQEQQEHCRVVSYEHDTPEHCDYPCRSLDYLARLAQECGTITVLCWEQHEHCHRFTLVQRIQQLTAQAIGGMS